MLIIGQVLTPNSKNQVTNSKKKKKQIELVEDPDSKLLYQVFT